MTPPETETVDPKLAEREAIKDINQDYKQKFGFNDPETGYVYKAPKGLSRELVESISEYKDEPQWMREFRLKALEHFRARPVPQWGADLNQIDFEDIHYFVRASERAETDWDDVPEDIKNTFDRLGIPEAERNFLAGVGAQYECLAEDTLVWTAEGHRPIREVDAGATVFAFDEAQERLVAAPVKGRAHKGRRPVLKVTVGNREIRATENHPFLTLEYTRKPGAQRGRYQRRWKYLRDLRPGDLVGVSKQLPDAGASQELGAMLEDRDVSARDRQIRVPERSDPSLMWWLGLYIGDGFIHHSSGRKRRVEIAIPATEVELRERLATETESLFGVTPSLVDEMRVTVGATQVAEVVERLGFAGGAHDKRVPEWVFRTTQTEREAFLAGYIDADGYVRDHAKNKDVAITSGNETMLDQIRQLALGCGLRCSRVTHFSSRHPLDRNRRIAGHRVFIGGNVGHLPLRNPRRRERVGKHRYTHGHSSAKGTDFRRHVNEWFGYVRIASIEPDGEAEVYDIEVDGPHNFVAEGLIVHNSEVVYHQVRKDLEEQGVHFVDMDTGLREYEDIVREHFASLIPANDNMLAALNSAVWSGGSFVYVPPGVKVEMPLQAYFRINTENMGQFERTLIIADEGSDVHYIEGCFLGGSMVRVRDGEKPIEEIEPGDEVLTHRGRFRRVRKPQSRRFVGPIRHIRFRGEGYRSLAVTPAHPFYAVKRRHPKDHNTEFDPQWIEAKDLQVGDYLGLPTDIDTGYDRDESWGSDVSIGRGRHTAVVERVDVELTPQTCRLIGLYLAEGSVPESTSYVNFDSAAHETEIREFTRAAMVDAFGLEPWDYEYSDRAARSLRYSSVRAARFFSQTFGRTTADLRIPDWVFGLGAEERAAVVRGLYDGEGHHDPAQGRYRISQTNQVVAQRIRELLLSLGIRATLGMQERSAPRRPIWQVAISADRERFEQVVLGERPHSEPVRRAATVISGDYVWMPVASIDVIEANCEVFNMSVEEDESYVCEGVVSHNCTAPVYSTDSLHSAVVELIARPGARIRYTTVQNWSQNVFNLVTKRARAERDATVEWVDCNLGCLTGDSMIGTPDRGPVPIRDIEEGDLVFGTDLTEMKPVARRVTATRDNGVQPTFKITTENFRQLEATANHPFLVLDRPPHGRSYAMRWRRLENISVGDYVAVGKGSGDAGRARFLGDYEYRAPSPRSRPRPVRLPLETSEELMWLLGVFIGDGGVERAKGAPRRVNFAVPPEDHARPRLVETLREVFDVEGVDKGPATLAVNSSVLGDFILWLGFGGNAREKRIPGWVFALPAAQKLAFIEGYLDSDGHERNSKVVDGVQLGQITWASVNKDLLEDLKLLLIDCGLEPRKISTYRSTRKLPLGPEERTYTTHYLAMDLRGNLEAIRSHRAPRPVVEFVRVASIDELGRQRTYDIEVDGIHNFTANGIVVHNSKITMKYPSVYLVGERAHGEILSIAFAGNGQHQDAGGKIIHAAPKTTSSIFAKSISKDGGRSTYRGLLEVAKGATEARSKVVCDALLLDPESRSDTYPTIRIDESDANVGHEASVSKIGEEQLYYLQSHGLDEEEASKLIVNGFIEPVVKELPMEYAVELNRLIELQMEGSIG